MCRHFLIFIFLFNSYSHYFSCLLYYINFVLLFRDKVVAVFRQLLEFAIPHITCLSHYYYLPPPPPVSTTTPLSLSVSVSLQLSDFQLVLGTRSFAFFIRVHLLHVKAFNFYLSCLIYSYFSAALFIYALHSAAPAIACCLTCSLAVRFFIST